MKSGYRTPLCPICEHRTGLSDDQDGSVIVLRVGCRKRSNKSGRPYFHPEAFDDDNDEKAYHFYCLQTVGFDFADANEYDDPMRCVFCRGTLEREPIYFEMELGRFDLDEDARLIWIPEREGRKICRIYACYDCVFDTMGEGRNNTARQRLGMELEAETTEIDYSSIGGSSARAFKSRRPPPRRLTG